MTYDLFHQTTPLTDDQRETYETKAQTQNEVVLSLFMVLIGSSPSQIHKRYCAAFPKAPLTSIRRAITTLEKQGKLIKLNRTSIGPYGRPEFNWRKS